MNGSENFENTEASFEKTLDITDKKCPSCGGVLNFDPEKGELVCAYCGTLVDIEDNAQNRAAELSLDEASCTAGLDWGAEKRVVVCEACGAETVYDADTVSGECPYCGSNHVMEAGAENIMAPGGVCPFTVTSENAKASFGTWIKGKLFCPSAAKNAARAGKLYGVYLPYWTFDSDTFTYYTARYGKTRTVRRGKETKTVTEWYSTRGTYGKFVNDALVCASRDRDNAALRKIEPFDTENNMVYNPEYLAGFASERYSKGLDESWEEAKRGITDGIREDVRSKVSREHFTSLVRDVRTSIRFSNVTYKYLLLPVWMSSFDYRGKSYRFMVNGRTGKVGGKYPVSPWRVAIAVLLGIAAVLLLALLFAEGDTQVYLSAAENMPL